MPLEGERVLLREERPSDLATLLALRNDLETQGWNKALPPAYTLEMYRRRHEAAEFSYDPREARFTIEEKATAEVVGTVGYTGLEPRLSASIGIMLARHFWGKGYALEAQELLLRFLFTELGLRVVRLWTHSGNPRAVGLAEKSGFRVAVRLREAVYKGGLLVDTLMMDLTREEYFQRHPESEDGLPQL